MQGLKRASYRAKNHQKIRVCKVHETLGGKDPLARANSEPADSDYILAIVTNNFFNSAEWYRLVLETLNASHRIIPLRLSDADLDGTGLDKLKSLPSLNRKISDFPNIDSAFVDIVT